MATLAEIVAQLDNFDAEDVIFVRPEWCEDAEARIFRLTDDHRIPPEAMALGFKYFLEIDVARQIVGEIGNSVDVALQVKVDRLIRYARYDA